MNIIDVSAETIDSTRFFCFMSKPKSEGYQRKREWLLERFGEGLRIKLLDLKEGGRGFIEYLPGEYAWRSVNAAGYMFIHCIWVVGKSKGNGYGKLLLDACVEDARSSGMKGVAMLTSEKVWLAKRGFFEAHGFECAETAEPSFSLMVKRFENTPSPSLTGDWQEKAAACGEGFTVFHSAQCPYCVDARETVERFARDRGVEYTDILVNDSAQLRELSPSPYGVFSVVYNGQLLSYHYLLEKDLVKPFDK